MLPLSLKSFQNVTISPHLCCPAPGEPHHHLPRRRGPHRSPSPCPANRWQNTHSSAPKLPKAPPPTQALLPQGLCTGCSRCLEHTSAGYLRGKPPHPLLGKMYGCCSHTPMSSPSQLSQLCSLFTELPSDVTDNLFTVFTVCCLAPFTTG